ncbi:MAG: Ig-like domain-containing protein [Ignavibacteriae bacterium]|nr:Ig-like domain-containing protein [Ignavibacteriota bacterium]
MKSKVIYLLLIMMFGVGLWNCEDLPPEALQALIAQVVGNVFDAQSGQPIFSATVILTSSLLIDSTFTAGDGSYSFSLDLQGLSSLGGTLRVSKSGYRSRDINFSANAGSTGYYDVFLDRDTSTGVIRDTSGTGLAHSIALISATPREISVYGVGGAETSILIWEVRDSLGFPIDIDHRDTVFFELVGTPVLGGAYISPAWALTNAAGRVATTVNSGTVSGVLQFIAKLRRESDGATLQSTPVLVTVHAGLPAQSHFTIGATQLNFAGYDWLGRTNTITVQVGDKYSNPVKLNTAVYFNTTGGVVTASGFTDASSHASATLYSGNPLPVLPALGAFPALYGDGTGYCYVRAYTLGEGGVNVSDSILILMSGRAQISIDTFFTNLHVDSGECVDVPITISDRFGNPLSPGTSIITQLEFSPPEGSNWSITASGLPRDPLDDYLTRGPGRTNFTLRICDGTPGGTPERIPFVVTIRVTSPNGNVFATITGDVGPP